MTSIPIRCIAHPKSFAALANVIPYNTVRSSSKLYISDADKSAGGGIVVPALEIIPLRFSIIDISTVTERLISSKCSCQGARCGKKLTPTVIGIFYHSILAAVNEFYYITLSI